MAVVQQEVPHSAHMRGAALSRQRTDVQRTGGAYPPLATAQRVVAVNTRCCRRRRRRRRCRRFNSCGLLAVRTTRRLQDARKRTHLCSISVPSGAQVIQTQFPSGDHWHHAALNGRLCCQESVVCPSKQVCNLLHQPTQQLMLMLSIWHGMNSQL